jgi:hypothetical protein
MITIAQVTATELRGASEKKKGSGWSIAPESSSSTARVIRHVKLASKIRLHFFSLGCLCRRTVLGSGAKKAISSDILFGLLTPRHINSLVRATSSGSDRGRVGRIADIYPG